MWWLCFKGDIGCPFSTRWYDSLGSSWNGLSGRVKQHPFYLVKNSSVHSDSFRCISLYMLMSSAHPTPLFCGSDPSLSFNFLTKPALNCPSFRKQSEVKGFAQLGINEFSESEVTCGQVWWPILGICALHLTHPSAHTPWTHTPWTHTWSSGQPYCCGARGTVGGLVPCSRVSAQSWYWGWRERWLFPPKSKWLDNWDYLGFGGI